MPLRVYKQDYRGTNPHLLFQYWRSPCPSWDACFGQHVVNSSWPPAVGQTRPVQPRYNSNNDNTEIFNSLRCTWPHCLFTLLQIAFLTPKASESRPPASCRLGRDLESASGNRWPGWSSSFSCPHCYSEWVSGCQVGIPRPTCRGGWAWCYSRYRLTSLSHQEGAVPWGPMVRLNKKTFSSKQQQQTSYRLPTTFLQINTFTVFNSLNS